MQLVEFKNHKKNILRGIFSPAKSSQGVIFVHGLERNTSEYKFRNYWQALAGKATLFRFDFSGCGMSDGQFTDFTVEKSTEELALAVKKFKRLAPNLKNISLVGHSIAGAITLNYLQDPKHNLDKVILFGPAFNQTELLKYYFVRSVFKGKKNIDWSNYQRNFPAPAFAQYIATKKHLRKAHYVFNKFFQENVDLDYQDFFAGCQLDLKNLLIIQSKKDVKVPIQSNDKLPREIKQIVLKDADHDFERPDWVQQYLAKSIDFLIK
ncbi:hypothetical protein COT97_03880 [Candidatus Falkowbacteria bacterium CG10_big_fil_rev_8_21_14_0_10_39_11]|uniref:Serine aminopeptidase S33 domain-containing protein n=1 Tax=Candidatus Falkowbacteria bacterium CG10_big_fil_rev_8_21_14_0_10_39_11 TaxID=1974565 RepID=A0A2H0V4D6_9BACT|nr:MAG: hypothetical protein COT97_03880 [Candidatus Falkowbacteria bacterium CG10_big_fil_rev_8_21_14_0_10_39_11]